ncbi:hypothetical protein [Kordiimonas sp.]|uniref:hypothetical protein n=1 Tax=Kordiimonas sp. TaxID=1970157 RepID=UPI003A930BDC
MFEVLHDPIRIVDRELNLQLVRGAGSFQTHFDYFCYIGQTANPLTCMLQWHEEWRSLTPEERESVPVEVDSIQVLVVDGFFGEGAFDIPSLTRAETLEVVRDAIMCRATVATPNSYCDFGRFKIRKNLALKVEFSPVFERWVEEAKSQGGAE